LCNSLGRPNENGETAPTDSDEAPAAEGAEAKTINAAVAVALQRPGKKKAKAT
jgi:hypothetical protein